MKDRNNEMKWEWEILLLIVYQSNESIDLANYTFTLCDRVGCVDGWINELDRTITCFLYSE